MSSKRALNARCPFISIALLLCAAGGIRGEAMSHTTGRGWRGGRLAAWISVGACENDAMAYRDIRIIGDPVLRTECDWITDIDDSVKSLVEDLLETVDEEGRAGLAANQIGVSLRAFSWNIDGEIGYILNPKLVDRSEDEYQDGDEGCLSVPGLWYPTERAWYARAEGIDLDGKQVIVEGEELMARCIQHELDHLEGHLYLDRLNRKYRAQAMKELRAKGL